MSLQRCGSGWRRIELARLGAGMILAAGSLGAAGLTLVENGAPRAVILVEAEPAAPAVETPAPKKKPPLPQLSKNQRAARAIQTYIAKMSGATLPIIEEGQPVEGSPAVQILVGHTAAARKLGMRIPNGFDPAIRPGIFEEEGYVLQTRGTALIVAGNNDGPYQGTLYAAYALLEKLGCRWYFPGEWGEIVPKQKTVNVPELDVTSRPDFAVRSFAFVNWAPDADRKAFHDWSVKVGFGDAMYPVAGDGFLGMLLPPAEYAESHPEYYAMDKQGKRPITAKSSPYFAMLCLSNPDVLAASIENLKAMFAGTKQGGQLISPYGAGFSPPDGTPYCYCEKCLAGGQNFTYPTYFHERFQSEEYAGFAAKLAEAFPDKYIGLQAYSLREMPPQGVNLPGNVSVAPIWPITSCVLHTGDDPTCWRHQETLKIAKGWRKLTPHVVMGYYSPGLMLSWVGGPMVPVRDIPILAAELPLYKKMGLKGYSTMGFSSFGTSWLSYYTSAKLSWDLTTDVAALKRDFYDTFFGPEASPHVQAWWDACEDALGKATCHVHEDWLINHVYTVVFTQKLHEQVEEARKAKMTDEQRGRFEAFALIADCLEAYAAMNEAESRLDYPTAITAAERMGDNQRRLDQIYSLFICKRGPGTNKISNMRLKELNQEASKADGTNGTMVAALPLEMKFARDRFNEGVLAEWYATDFDDAQWGAKNTYHTWEQQDPPEDAAGHDYDGYGWYRATVDVPKNASSKPLRLHLGGVINEGWVWINGQYAGHSPYRLWWGGQAPADLDVTRLVKPGERNTVAIRVWNDADVGGLYRRGFFYLPAGGK